MSSPVPATNRLSQFTTNWSANQSCDLRVGEALHALLHRYATSVYRYLRSAVKDATVADDLAQEFAYRLVRGDFRDADPQRGRFRDFLKRSLSNLVNNHFRRRKSQPKPVTQCLLASLSTSPDSDCDAEFDEQWRREILSRAWDALDNLNDGSRSPYFAVLHFRAEHPELTSAELANELSPRIGRPLSAGWVRQTLSRARQRFAILLRKEVAKTLRWPTDDEVDDELVALQFAEYCRQSKPQYRSTNRPKIAVPRDDWCVINPIMEKDCDGSFGFGR